MTQNEFVIRGKTASGSTEVLNFGGYKPGYAYRLTEFSLYPSSAIANTAAEMVGSVTANKTIAAPTDPDFSDPGLIATTSYFSGVNNDLINNTNSVINDTFLITQDLLLMVQDQSSGGNPINWQCRFVTEKMNSSEEAVANFKQFTIFDG